MSSPVLRPLSSRRSARDERAMGRAANQRKPRTVSGQLERLRTASRLSLLLQWNSVFGTEPPASTELIRRALAHNAQEAAYGTLPERVAQVLSARAQQSSRGNGRPTPFLPAREGTQLTRVWRDRTYTVIVTEDGMLFEGRLYRSLTQIASEITGTHYPGPRFFGLRERRAQARAGV